MHLFKSLVVINFMSKLFHFENATTPGNKRSPGVIDLHKFEIILKVEHNQLLKLFPDLLLKEHNLNRALLSSQL